MNRLFTVAAANAQIIVKTAATSTTAIAVSIYDITWYSVATALIGAAASFYFESDQTPKKIPVLCIGIVLIAYTAVLVAIVIPVIPGFAWSGVVDVSLRAGILGVSIRFLWEQIRRVCSTWRVKNKSNPDGE